MLEVQKYLKEKGLDSLVKEFNIKVSDYPDRVVLNYDQIESARFHPICDECRALILKKDTWEVMANSFRRFYNYLEGVDNSLKVIDPVRLASYEGQLVKSFSIIDAIIESKLDGSLLSFYWDGEKWNCSTRSKAFAEGQTNMGRTFAQVFEDAAKKTKLYQAVKDNESLREFTFVFELTSPETRVTTPFDEIKITLINARSNKEEYNYRELSRTELAHLATVFNVNRPKTYTVKSYIELLDLVQSMHCMDEGVVLVWEVENGSHIRVKCKNPAFLAISNMRGNGAVSPKRILTLVMKNEQHEYLKYFAADEPYFNFVGLEYLQAKERIKSIYRDNMHLVSQKDFALAIMAKTVYNFEQGIMFSMRKKGGDIESHLKELGSDKIAKGMNLRATFAKKFNVTIEEEG